MQATHSLLRAVEAYYLFENPPDRSPHDAMASFCEVTNYINKPARTGLPMPSKATYSIKVT